MSNLISDFTSAIENEFLSEDLYKKCWFDELPKNQQPPNPEEVQWLKSILSDDAFFESHSDQWDELLQFILFTERQIAFVNQYSETANIYRRLYLCAEICKALYFGPKEILSSINSIIIYPSSNRLRKDYNEAGVVIARGRSRVLRNLYTLRGIWSAIPLFFTADKTAKSELTKFNKQNLPKLNNWIGLIRVGLSDKQFLQFEEYLDSLINDASNEFLKTLERALSRGKADKLYLDTIQSLTETIPHVCNLLSEKKAEAKFPDQTSIHISWAQQLISDHIQNSNLLFHELAHVLDFTYNGFNGTPPPRQSKKISFEKQEELWDGLWNRAESGEMSFLDKYSLTNNLEFFAVGAETFLSNPEYLKSHSEELYNALYEVFGFTPIKSKTRSQWQIAKRFFFSKLNVF